MNLLDCIVKKIIGIPYKKYGKFFLKVSYECYGVDVETNLMFNSLQEADGIIVGYKFLS